MEPRRRSRRPLLGSATGALLVLLALGSPPAALADSAVSAESPPVLTVPGVTVPGVTVPGVTVTTLTVPGVTLPGVTVPPISLPPVTLPPVTVTVPPVLSEIIGGTPAAPGDAATPAGATPQSGGDAPTPETDGAPDRPAGDPAQPSGASGGSAGESPVGTEPAMFLPVGIPRTLERVALEGAGDFRLAFVLAMAVLLHLVIGGRGQTDDRLSSAPVAIDDDVMEFS